MTDLLEIPAFLKREPGRGQRRPRLPSRRIVMPRSAKKAVKTRKAPGHVKALIKLGYSRSEIRAFNRNQAATLVAMQVRKRS